MNSRCEVLVCGAGPVGLVTALGLARAGLNVTVIEAEAGINSAPRAAVYYPMVLELLERLEVIDAVHRIGLRNDSLQFRRRDSTEHVNLSAAVIAADTPYPYQLHFGQDQLAAILLGHLQGYANAHVRFQHPLTGLRQDHR